MPTRTARILLPSDSLRYSYSASAPVGSKVDPASIKIDGVAVDPAAAYRVTMNSFLADGGDGFSVFKALHQPARRRGRPRRGCAVLPAGTPAAIAPPPLNRITRLP